MQIQTINTPGSYHSDFYTNNQYTGSSDTANGYAYKKSGSGGTVVRGDFEQPLPFNYTINESVDLKGTMTLREGSSKTIMTGTLPNMDATSSLLNKFNASDPYNKALAKIYDKIRSDVDLSIDIYQGRQTISMLKGFASTLANPTRTLSKALGSLVSRGKIRKGSALISNKWLEWQYGIKPTMSTIFTLCDGLRELISNEQGFLEAFARASSIEQAPATVYRGSWSSVCDVKLIGEDSRRSEISLVYGISDAERNALSQFTSLNPVSFIYENIPLSFLLDWMVDIGGYLRMMETALMTGLELRSGYVTSSRRKAIEVSVQYSYTDKYSRTYVTKGDGWARHISMTRSPLGSLPRPRVPSLRVSLGEQRLLSAAALLRGLLH